MLKSIFVSYHFDHLPRQFVAKLESAFRSLGIRLTQGDQLAGGILSDEIKNLIDESDGVFGILTERDPNQNREWVISELVAAQSTNKDIFLFLQKGQVIPPTFQGREYYSFDSIDDANLWLKILATINIWKRRKGEDQIAKLLPVNVVRELQQINLDNVTVKFRQVTPDFEYTNWALGKIRKADGGILLFLPSIKEKNDIEVEIKYDGRKWSSVNPRSSELIFELKESN